MTREERMERALRDLLSQMRYAHALMTDPIAESLVKTEDKPLHALHMTRLNHNIEMICDALRASSWFEERSNTELREELRNLGPIPFVGQTPPAGWKENK